MAQMSGDQFSVGKLARLLNETEAEDMRDLLKLLLPKWATRETAASSPSTKQRYKSGEIDLRGHFARKQAKSLLVENSDNFGCVIADCHISAPGVV